MNRKALTPYLVGAALAVLLWGALSREELTAFLVIQPGQGWIGRRSLPVGTEAPDFRLSTVDGGRWPWPHWKASQCC